MTEQDKFDYVPIVKIENKLYAEGLTSTRKVSIIVNECIQHPCFRGFWIRDDRGPEWYHNVCVCRVAQFLAMGKKIEARFEFPQLENKESKPDSRKLPDCWYKLVYTGLSFKGHKVFLAPTSTGKQADKLVLTQLDKFIKSNMPLIYEIIRDETTGTAVEGALNK